MRKPQRTEADKYRGIALELEKHAYLTQDGKRDYWLAGAGKMWLKHAVAVALGSTNCPTCGKPLHIDEQRLETKHVKRVLAMYECHNDQCAAWKVTEYAPMKPEWAVSTKAVGEANGEGLAAALVAARVVIESQDAEGADGATA